MLPLIQTLFEIILFRKGPEHIPRSRVLLVMAITMLILSVLVRVVLLDRSNEQDVVHDLFSAFIAVTAYAAISVGFGKGERMSQLLTAALGCGALLSAMLTFGILFAQLIGSKTFEALLIWTYLPWAIAVRGHIIARVIDKHWYIGLVFAVLIFVLQYIALRLALAD